MITGYTFCKDHKYISIESNSILKYHSQLAMEIVGKDQRVTYDLLVKVGELRNQDHRQLEEIQAYLKCSAAHLSLSTSTIAMISLRYLEFCKRLHEKNEDNIQGDILSNGGYVMHMDGSTEQRCGKTSFVLRDSLSDHVLVSEMIDSENRDEVIVLLKKVRDKYGMPLVILSDLRSWFVSVCQEVFGSKVRHVLCHYHFLRTFKVLFSEPHKQIQVCLTQTCKLSSLIKGQLVGLKTVIKDHGAMGVKLKSLEDIKAYWASADGDALIAYRQILLWILKYKQDSSGKGVPFDLVYLDFYKRFQEAKRLINKIFSDKKRTNPITRINYYHNGFLKIAEKMGTTITNNKDFKAHIRLLEYSRKWFAKLRGTLFMEAAQESRDNLAPLSKRYQLTRDEAKKIPKKITQYLKQLNKELRCCKDNDKKEILNRFKKQTKKYRANLTVPILKVAVDGKSKVYVTIRTNNFLELSFRCEKSHIRRQTGRSKLPKEFGSVGALLPYYKSMIEHKMFSHLFADPKKLAEEFSKLFENSWKMADNVVVLPKNPKKTLSTSQNNPIVAYSAKIPALVG